MSSGAQTLEESDLPGAGVIGVCEPPDWGCWESALGLQKEQAEHALNS